MNYSSNLLQAVKAESIGRLSELYTFREAESMVNRLILHFLGMTRVDQQLQKEKRLSESEMLHFIRAMNRLMRHEPLQYVVGETEFYGLTLKVGPQALIPRPETEQLVDLIINNHPSSLCHVLDVGTGSGCIALALKQVRKLWQVTGVDVSPEALALAQENALHRGLSVDLKQCDILDTVMCRQVIPGSFHIVVSNPPYVLESEKSKMAGNVLNYEPPQALFVPSDDPLLFYRKIKDFAADALLSGGWLYMEINEQQSCETARLFSSPRYHKPLIVKDFHGKERFIRVQKK
jgi:release factor glutamine methyltransferase